MIQRVYYDTFLSVVFKLFTKFETEKKKKEKRILKKVSPPIIGFNSGVVIQLLAYKQFYKNKLGKKKTN